VVAAAPDSLLQLLTPPNDYDARPVVDYIVRLGLSRRASDIHLRPVQDRVEVLLRLDGVLAHPFDLPRGIYDRLLVGLKNMAHLASYKKSQPQDGSLQVDGTEVRVATTPTFFGEKAVLRVIRPDTGLRSVADLGYTDTESAALIRIVDQPQGLVLATGPAGSGKTTTLLAALMWLYQRHRERTGATLNVVTLEDPIEVVVPEFTQTQVQPAMEMTFASGLRSMLRQDPEVVLVGEIRDPDTARAAVQASLTGHLVCSTVHARDSLGVIPRLLEMGIEPYLLSASLTGVVYQRLIRQVCAACQGSGCSPCDTTGHRGRTAVPEILEVTEELRQGILDRKSLADLRLMVSTSLRTLKEAAALRVASGQCTAEEVRRVIP
jgi:type II secretory ATPase GspE/PulE/Tfp pilus assembly ATPase PilB-like protein